MSRDEPKRLGELVDPWKRVQERTADRGRELEWRQEGKRELEQLVDLRQCSDAQLAKLFVRRLYRVADAIAALNSDELYKVAVRGLQKELWDLADEIEERLGR
jgi:hypothetical protein